MNCILEDRYAYLLLFKNEIAMFKKQKMPNDTIINLLKDTYDITEELCTELINCDKMKIDLTYKCIRPKLDKMSLAEIREHINLPNIENIKNYLLDMHISEPELEHDNPELEPYSKPKLEPYSKPELEPYSKSYPEQDSSEQDSSDDDEKIMEFEWKPNQINGINAAINSNFASGIHSQATGTGKSLMALKIIWEFHKKNSKSHVMWLCERKDIPLKLFFKGYNGKCAIKHYDNYKFWKENDIIDMDQFQIIEYVYNKSNNWIDIINNYNGDKPLFLIMNRAFITTRSANKKYKYKYQELHNNIPKFAIIDECHSAMANQTYKLLTYMKWNWKTTIQGLSATPYRKSKSYVTIDIDIDCPDKDKLKTQENENKLINIFNKVGNINQLNILSWFNLKEAIETGIILEPVFHWYHINKYVEHKNKDDNNYSDEEIASVLTVFNNVIEQCKYKKCIVWCRLTKIADAWYNIFAKNKNKYANLSNIKHFIDYSKLDNADYDKFYDMPDNAILFCANKHREGSDIPYLSCCLFLDKVKSRCDIAFIQCIGRVLRRDIENVKESGHIMDGCVIEDDANKMKDIINKLLRYYVQLYEFAKSDFHAVANDRLSENKLQLYEQILSSLQLVPEEKKLYINLEKNNKRITINLADIDLKTMEWNKIIHNFEKILKDELIMNDYEEFIVFKKKVIGLGISSKYEYDDNWLNYGLHYNDVKIEPAKYFPTYFTNWYAFLDIDIGTYPKTKEDWIKQCKKLQINHNNYMKIANDPNNHLPTMPEEIYIGFTNIDNELELIIKDTRR